MLVLNIVLVSRDYNEFICMIIRFFKYTLFQLANNCARTRIRSLEKHPRALHPRALTQCLVIKFEQVLTP